MGAKILSLVLSQILLNPSKEPTSTFSVDVDLVNVVCSVRDRHGAYVKDLRKEDFEVREDGKRREITYFAREVDTPLTVALLLDVSGSVQNILGIEKVAAGLFFKEVLRPQDQAMLVGFAQRIAVWQDLTPSVAQLQEALAQAAPFSMIDSSSDFRPRGGTLLYDAVNLVARNKLRKPPGRKAMILITDGLDNGSLIKKEEAGRAAQEADTVIYAIHYQDQDVSSHRGDDGITALEKMSQPTGGRTFHISGRTTLDKVFDTIREEMRSQYGIGFKPTAQAGDGAWHKLELKTKSGLKVNARDGYFAIRR